MSAFSMGGKRVGHDPGYPGLRRRGRNCGSGDRRRLAEALDVVAAMGASTYPRASTWTEIVAAGDRRGESAVMISALIDPGRNGPSHVGFDALLDAIDAAAKE